MRKIWRKLSIEQRNLLVIAIVAFVAIIGFCSWEMWRRMNAVFVPVWEKQLGDSVWKIAFSPDGQFLGVLSWQGQKATISLLSITDGQIVRTFKNVSRAEKFAFSPDGQRLVVGSLVPGSPPGEVLLLRVADGQPIWRKRSDRIVHIVFSPDGHMIVSASSDGSICFWRAIDGKLLRTLKVSEPLLPSKILSISPDGRLLAVGGNSLTVWRVKDRRLIHQLKTFNWELILVVSFSPDGRYLALGKLLDKPGDTLTFWRVNDWTEIQKLRGHHCFELIQGITDFDFSPDSYWLVSAGLDGRLKLWSIHDGKLLGEKNFGKVVDRRVFEFLRRVNCGVNWRHVNWKLVKWALYNFIRPKFICGVDFSPDGKHVAIAWEENRAGLFRVRLSTK